MNNDDYNSLANKLISIEDTFNDIRTITNMIDMWIRKNDYQLIPIMNMQNEKINNVSEIIKR